MTFGAHKLVRSEPFLYYLYELWHLLSALYSDEEKFFLQVHIFVLGPNLRRWNFFQTSQLSIRIGAHNLFRPKDVLENLLPVWLLERTNLFIPSGFWTTDTKFDNCCQALYSDVRKNLYRCTLHIHILALNYCGGFFSESLSYVYEVVRTHLSADFWTFRIFSYAIWQILWHHLASKMRIVYRFWKSYPFWKKLLKPHQNWIINRDAMIVQTMHPVERIARRIGAWQIRSPLCMAVELVVSILKGNSYFSIQFIVFPLGGGKMLIFGYCLLLQIPTACRFAAPKNKHHIFPPTAGARGTIFLKLCLIDDTSRPLKRWQSFFDRSHSFPYRVNGKISG